MKVETYEIEEINSSEAATMAADSTAIALIERLGLSGQQKLVNTKTDTRHAYRRMTAQENLVFETLFPEKSKVKDYSTEIIPLRVLEVLEKAKESGQFLRFEIWHSRTRKDDPLLVGFTGTADPQTWDPDYISERGRFLVARWGDSLLPFSKLAAQAKALWTATRSAKLKKAIATSKTALETLKDDADAAFGGGDMPNEPEAVE